MTVTLNPILPVWLIVLAGIALLGALAHGLRTLAGKNVARRWIAILGCLRIAAILLFVAVLLRPVIFYTRELLRGPDMLALVDVSESMASPGALGGGSRLDEAVEALRESPLAEDFLDHFNVHWFVFDRTARPAEAGDLADLVPDGETTRCAESIETAWSFYRQAKLSESEAEPQMPRLFLVTDGNDRATCDVPAASHQLGLTIDALSLPQPHPGETAPRVSIAGVQSPGRVLLGSDSRLSATLRQESAAEIPLAIILSEDEQEILRHEFTFGEGEAERQLTLTFRPASAGIKRYKVSVGPRDANANVASVPRELSIRVESRKHEVLFLEDAWRWEFRFLRRVFERDPSFSFTGFLSRGSGMYMQYGEPDREVNLAGFPQTRAELSWFDTFVLGDVDPNRWPRALAPAMRDLVVNEGKSLIVLAGPSIAGLARHPAMAPLLPVIVAPMTAHPVAGPIDVWPSLEALASPMFFAVPSSEGASRWTDLPPMEQIYAPLRKKPAATILLEAAHQANEYGKLIVAAEHTVGRGRVLYIGTDTLWKWQMLPASDADNNTPYSVFWQQALRGLQPSRLAEAGVDARLSPDRSRYLTKQTVGLSLEIHADRDLPDMSIETEVILPDDRSLPLVFDRDMTRDGVYSSQFQPPIGGQYRINADVLSNGRIVASSIAVFDVEDPLPEAGQTGVDEAWLEHVVDATGGSMIDPNNPDTWPPHSSTDKRAVRQARSVDLWHSFWLLLALTGVLGADWLVRLMRGFV